MKGKNMSYTEYKKYYHTKQKEDMINLLEDINFATDMNYIKWEKKWDSVLNEHYYTSGDEEYKEKYILYDSPENIGLILQITDDKNQCVHEVDDKVYNAELQVLKEKVMSKFKNKYKDNKEPMWYEDYVDRYYNNSYYVTSEYDRKKKKQEKAQKQLAEVQSLRNYERL